MQDLTHGSIRGHLLRMSGFVLVGLFVQALYALVDLYWVGRLGKEAVAAVSVVGNLVFVVMGLTQVLNVGTAALVSHAAGRKDRAAAQAAFGQAMSLSLAGAAALTLALYLLMDAYCRALTSDAETQIQARA